MEIFEAAALKNELKDKIEKLLQDFEKQTGAKVDTLTLEYKEGLNLTKVKSIKIEVRI